MTQKQKFYKIFQKKFITDNIEDTGGFVNFINIKLNYYNKFEELLKNNVDIKLKQHIYETYPPYFYVKMFRINHKMKNIKNRVNK